jgi:hypothetical protein
MTETDSTRPVTTPSTVIQPNEACEPTPAPPSSRNVPRAPRITVAFGCLMCSRDFGILVCASLPVCGAITIQQPGGFHIKVALEHLRFLRCSSCGGSILPTEITREEVRVERRIDWSQDRPRVGRPPKWLVEQRRKNGQEGRGS